MLELTHPIFLGLLLAVPALVLTMRRSLAEMTPAQRLVCLAVRTVLVFLLIAALAGVRILLPSTDLAVVFAVDHSASISPEALKQARGFVAASLEAQQARDTSGLVGFAQGAELWQPATENAHLPAVWPELKERARTNLGGVLDFASAVFPADKTKRLVLLSDGNDTEATATQAAQMLASRGIELFTVPLRNADTPEVLVEKVEVPRRLKTGEPFDLSANIQSNAATSAKVKLYQNQFLLETREVELKPGENEFRALNLKADGNFISYEVEVVAALDTSVENNRAQATASLRGQPRVLVVEGEEAKARPLADALRSENIGVETRGSLGAPKTLEDLQQFDLFVLSDLSALALGRDQMELYRRWVQDFGGGFVMLGGENSFGVGGYFRTPIEQMLPVRMEHDDRQDVPSVALLVVLDRSGSMTALVQGQTKISLADMGAVFAMNVLQPKDYFGVLAVDTKVHTVAPLQQHVSRAPIEQKILEHHCGWWRDLHLHVAGGGISAAPRRAGPDQTRHPFFRRRRRRRKECGRDGRRRARRRLSA